MNHRIETVSEDLASHLERCPECGGSAVIQSRMWTADGRLPRRQISITCNNGCGDDFEWHDTLYAAVSVWEVRAKLLTTEKPKEFPYSASTYQGDSHWEVDYAF